MRTIERRAPEPAAEPVTAEQRVAAAPADPPRQVEAGGERRIERAPAPQPVEAAPAPEEAAPPAAGEHEPLPEDSVLAASSSSAANPAPQRRVLRRQGAASEAYYQFVVREAASAEEAAEIQSRLRAADLPASVIAEVNNEGEEAVRVVVSGRGDEDTRQLMMQRAQEALR